MTKSQENHKVGDFKTPPLQASAEGLRIGSDHAEKIQVDTAPAASNPSLLQSAGYAVKNVNSNKELKKTCMQTLWFSFFFDGTGNNRYVDEEMKKHSNVAKLFMIHKPVDKINGTYSFYLQGVGTYFPEIGDDGGSALGYGCGSKGTERLNYALKKFDEYIRAHLQLAKSPSNAITEINISVFGFSRGAALARAFINKILEEKCVLRQDKWVLKEGYWPIRIRFMGLFDTVASVGMPMSTNTTSTVGTVASSVSYMIKSRLDDYADTRPTELAFSSRAAAGADPAPGRYDGHSDWGNNLEINQKVEEVRHFVAAHEIRNSFPLESVSVFRSNQILKPSQFYETVYPGVHSDIGGSYAPGEGGHADSPFENLGLVPLVHMYNFALRQGVPLLPMSAWLDKNKEDFKIDAEFLKSYNYYFKKIGASSNLGEVINKNMRLYFSWRFREIRMKKGGDKKESKRISVQKRKFEESRVALDRELSVLKKSEKNAASELQLLLERRKASGMGIPQNSNLISTPDSDRAELKAAQSKVRLAHREFLEAKSRIDALPNMENLEAMLNIYDSQLLADAKAIQEVFAKPGRFSRTPELARRNDLRPHYKALVEAYENEFVNNNGLKDEEIIKFFENYVHDSLAGFAKDATLPSDPRVIYLGGDEKYRYARADDAEELKGSGSEIA